MLSFEFGGKDSFNDYGIVIEKRPTISSPKRRVNYIDIPGKSSSVRHDENTYEDITILLECALKSKDNIVSKIDEIKAWLFTTGESDLIFSFQPDKKYIAQVVNAIDFTQIFKYTSKFPILFNCRPFKYSVQNIPLTVHESGTNIINPGTIASLPIINIYGSGDIKLKINNDEIGLIDLSGEVIINSEVEDCYDEDLNNLNYKMNGKFPVLEVGQNLIQWTGNVDKLEIIPNWRWL
jgi:predicted phage tail component-like protein